MMGQNVVITMAGRGSRFYDAGFTVPKYEIMAHGQSLFHWSILSLKNFISEDARFIFVCLAENRSSGYVKSQCSSFGLKNVHVIELAEITDGQATSAYVSKSLWEPNEPLLIYNIDTYVRPRALTPADIRPGSDGWIPCFRAAGDHWSFVKTDESGWATEVAEKVRISDYASVGLYWFASAREYASAYEDFFSDPTNLVKGERYVAPLYKHLISHGKKISISDLSVNDVHVLGTPTELNIFLEKNESQIR